MRDPVISYPEIKVSSGAYREIREQLLACGHKDAIVAHRDGTEELRIVGLALTEKGKP